MPSCPREPAGSQRFAISSASANPIAAYTASVAKSSQVFIVMLASTRLATPDIVEPVPESNADMSPVNMAPTATPTRMMRKGDSPPRHDRLYTNPNATSPPANANTGVKNSSIGKNAVTSTAANDAPALTPMMPGSASGLRIAACKSTPATAVAAPPAIAMRMRGRRMS